MILTKEHYEEIITLLNNNDFLVSPEDWNEDDVTFIWSEHSSFCLTFDKNEILLSFDIDNPPDYVALLTQEILTKFSHPETIIIMENYYCNNKQEIYYGEEAVKLYFNEMKEAILKDLKNEYKINKLMECVDPVCMEC